MPLNLKYHHKSISVNRPICTSSISFISDFWFFSQILNLNDTEIWWKTPMNMKAVSYGKHHDNAITVRITCSHRRRVLRHRVFTDGCPHNRTSLATLCFVYIILSLLVLLVLSFSFSLSLGSPFPHLARISLAWPPLPPRAALVSRVVRIGEREREGGSRRMMMRRGETEAEEKRGTKGGLNGWTRRN